MYLCKLCDKNTLKRHETFTFLIFLPYFDKVDTTKKIYCTYTVLLQINIMYNITVNSCVQHNRFSVFLPINCTVIDIKESALNCYKNMKSIIKKF